MKISIITPNFNSGHWLSLCVASVSDQQGVAVEHVIQDPGSTDGCLDDLVPNECLRVIVEKDEGMYDAINRGIKASNGEIIAHLNADEQYLPGALQAVVSRFSADPELDVLFADSVIVNQHGECICCRKSLVPQRATRFADNPTITSSIFVRRRTIEKHRLYFDTRWRILSDAIWMRSCVTSPGIKMAVLRQYTSAFTESGDNLDLSPAAYEESVKLRALRPKWAQRFERPLKAFARFRRLLAGGFHQKPFEYHIYTKSSPHERVRFVVSNPSCIWWTRAPRTAGGTYRAVKRFLGNRCGQRS
jgi:glycosyltransferase involved in cell wall biosynthesis